MFFGWIDESGDENCYHEKEGQTPVYVLCACLLTEEFIAKALSELSTIERNYRNNVHIKTEIKGTKINILRNCKHNPNIPDYIKNAEQTFLNNIIDCLIANNVKIVSRAFGKRIRVNYKPQDLYSFAYLTLFEQIFLLTNFEYKKLSSYPNLPISIISDTLPTNKVKSSRQTITNIVNDIKGRLKKEFSILWSFDLSSENILIRVADIIAKILYGVAHNSWNAANYQTPIYLSDIFFNKLKPLMFGFRCDRELNVIEKASYRVRWFPPPCNDIKEDS